MMSQTNDETNELPATERRDFLYYATASTGAVAAGAAVWPLINAMNPSADVLALSSTEVDISAIEVGQSITVKWRGRPVFIRRRTQDEIDAARVVPMDDLSDPESDEAHAHARRERDRTTAIRLQRRCENDRQHRQDAGVDQRQQTGAIGENQLHASRSCSVFSTLPR